MTSILICGITNNNNIPLVHGGVETKPRVILVREVTTCIALACVPLLCNFQFNSIQCLYSRILHPYRMVEATYEQTNGRVIIGAGMSEQFSVNMGMRQGSALSPLLFIVVMELISRKVSMKDTSRKLLYADDLVTVAEDKEELN